MASRKCSRRGQAAPSSSCFSTSPTRAAPLSSAKEDQQEVPYPPPLRHRPQERGGRDQISERKMEGDTPQGGKICDGRRTQPAAGMGKDPESRGFDWAGFFRNRNVIVQAFLYVLLFYKTAPNRHDVALLLVWFLLLVPLCVLNLMGTHLLKDLAAKRAMQA